MSGLNQTAARLAAGETSARALVEDCLAAIDAQDGEGARVFTKVHAEAARKAASAMDALRAARAAPSSYAGIPVSVKDLFDLAGEVTMAGSTALADAAPALRDAPAIARLRAAGFVVVGRTNMTEFAFSGLGLNPHYGTPLNPYDRAVGRIPGGSSSGAAVSVADGMAHAGIGTDTGGSCRIPAALCGLVGFKPTARRISLDGIVPLSPSLDSVGPIARSVACCAVLDAVMAGSGSGSVAQCGPGGLRLGVPQSFVLDGMDRHVADAFEAVLARLSAADARIVEAPFACFADIPAINAKGGLPAPEAYAWHRALIAEKGDDYDPRVLSRIMRGREQEAADYLDVLRARADLIERFEHEERRFDALLLPTTPLVAPTFAEVEADADYTRLNLLMLRNPTVTNMVDGAAISLPMHAPGAPPCGLMLMCRGGEDRRLLGIAAGIEALLSKTD